MRIKLFSPNGNLIHQEITDFISVDLARNINAVGAMELVLPDTYSFNYFSQDAIIEVWNSFDNGRNWYLEGDTCWFVQRVSKKNGLLTVNAVDATQILQRRIVAYYAADTDAEGVNIYTLKSGPAEKLLREIFHENFAEGVESLQYPGEVIPPAAGGPGTPLPFDSSMRKLARSPLEQIQYIYPDYELSEELLTTASIEWQVCYDAMKSIVDSVAKEQKIYFDIVYSPASASSSAYAGSFSFRTWFDRRGREIRTVIFSQENENLLEPELVMDYSEVANWIYVGGNGSGQNRVVTAVIDDDWIGWGPLQPIEAWVDGPDTDNEDSLTAFGKAEHYQKQAKLRVNAVAVSTPWHQWKRDFYFGDTVTALIDGFAIPCTIEKYRLQNSEDGLKLTVPLSGEISISELDI